MSRKHGMLAIMLLFLLLAGIGWLLATTPPANRKLAEPSMQAVELGARNSRPPPSPPPSGEPTSVSIFEPAIRQSSPVHSEATRLPSGSHRETPMNVGDPNLSAEVPEFSTNLGEAVRDTGGPVEDPLLPVKERNHDPVQDTGEPIADPLAEH